MAVQPRIASCGVRGGATNSEAAATSPLRAHPPQAGEVERAARRAERHHDPRSLRLPPHRRHRSRIPPHRPRARSGADHRACCMKVSAPPRCGATFRRSCRPRPAPACSSIRAPAMARPSPAKLPRPLDYMHREALDVLPKLLEQIGFRRGILVGHSDGASIAAIYAGGVQDHRVRAIALMAPHFIVEDISVKSIAEIKTAYETTNLREKLARWHKDVDNAFYGWNGAWLDPKFRRLGYFGIPRLYPRPDRDHPGRRRPVWDPPAGRDRAGGVLLSGRCDDPGRGPDIRRIGKRRRRRCMRSRNSQTPCCRRMRGLEGTGRLIDSPGLVGDDPICHCREEAAAPSETLGASAAPAAYETKCIFGRFGLDELR